MHINATHARYSELVRGFLVQIVFKIAAFGLDASVKLN